jgi:uncharacterized protein YjbI with pentapeptide repeats
MLLDDTVPFKRGEEPPQQIRYIRDRLLGQPFTKFELAVDKDKMPLLMAACEKLRTTPPKQAGVALARVMAEAAAETCRLGQALKHAETEYSAAEQALKQKKKDARLDSKNAGTRFRATFAYAKATSTNKGIIVVNGDFHGETLRMHLPRSKPADVAGDFNKADLRGSVVAEATLSGDFSGANLSGAILSFTNVTGNFVGAKFNRAVVQDAALFGDFRGADFREVGGSPRQFDPEVYVDRDAKLQGALLGRLLIKNREGQKLPPGMFKGIRVWEGNGSLVALEGHDAAVGFHEIPGVIIEQNQVDDSGQLLLCLKGNKEAE